MAKIAKFDLEKISESANTKIDKLKAEYCPICGNVKSAKGEIVREVIL